ncbi:MAG TPA: hypothetical protein EYG95_00850 [Campylobacterales bacterium]|nr:hypothetical protein [Campylobacterales bacterium]
MKKVVLATGIAALLLGSSVSAKESAVTLSTKSYKEVVKIDSSGAKKIFLEEAKKIVPGDTVVYKNSIINNSNKSVSDMVLNNAIPKYTEYVADSAKCEKDCDILFSVDGGKEFDKPENLMVNAGDKARLALPREYTNVRWILTSALDANSITDVSFKTRLQ